MSRAIDVQFLGSAVVVGAFAASEGAVRYLDAYPGSTLAWYLNIRVFGIFEAARVVGSPLQPLFHPAGLWASAALLVALAGFRAVRFRFGLALAANLCFLATLFLAGTVLRGGAAHAQLVSLNAITAVPSGTGTTLAMLLAASSTAFLASHVAFVRAVAQEHWRRAVRPVIDIGSA